VKARHLFAFAIISLIAFFIIGALVTDDLRRVYPSPEAVDSIARAESQARIQRDYEWSRTQQMIVLGTASGAGAIALVMTCLMVMAAMPLIVARWARRHDRMPDRHGRFAIMRMNADAPMINPNIGYQIGQAVSEATMLQLAQTRAMVDATAAAFSAGIERGEARMRQRHIGESPAPEGWTIAEPMPQAQPEPQMDFVLVDDTGERKLTDQAQSTPQTKTNEVDVWR